jgi:hypothetical protein
MGEWRSIQVRWEVFNIFNHPNFQLPNRNYNETAAGVISGVQGAGRSGPRTMQFAVKYIFGTNGAKPASSGKFRVPIQQLKPQPMAYYTGWCASHRLNIIAGSLTGLFGSDRTRRGSGGHCEKSGR